MHKLSLRLKHLSQEHHTAMLLAYAAREAMPQSEADLPSFVTKVCEIFENEMEPHFREEERFALPKLRTLGRDDLADRTLDEHNAMRVMLAELARAPTAEKVSALSSAMEAHVKFEEEVVWEVLETAFDKRPQPAAV
ncbi:hemerythrin domain-containing protein [Uliginosibacterium sp. H3]|uniref:Hemerythrin domain-containing protein n=1 Tax=Uliginosibacterium silvisoli TaxID=3114758 RepID=A0ABU6K0W0_9RHOO|nr:hemerythrin domain-containing protein [Uliginosibacterium sp. H3]